MHILELLDITNIIFKILLLNKTVDFLWLITIYDMYNVKPSRCASLICSPWNEKIRGENRVHSYTCIASRQWLGPDPVFGRITVNYITVCPGYSTVFDGAAVMLRCVPIRRGKARFSLLELSNTGVSAGDSTLHSEPRQQNIYTADLVTLNNNPNE